jgi:hypothetical protein
MIADRGESNRLEEELAEESHRNRLRSRAYGLHSWHGFFPAWIASSRLAYLTTFFAEIFAAGLQSARWNTAEFLEAT